MMIPPIYSAKTRTVRDFKVAGRVILGVLLLFFVFCAGTLCAQTYADLYDFPGKPGGCCPQYPSVMAQGRDGDLYGITTTGGVNNVDRKSVV